RTARSRRVPPRCRRDHRRIDSSDGDATDDDATRRHLQGSDRHGARPVLRGHHGLAPSHRDRGRGAAGRATFELKAGPVRKERGDVDRRMLAYIGPIPGPTLKATQGSEVPINFTNEADVESTVHWHGLRLDFRYDGVPQGRHQGMQAPTQPGGSFSYKLRFPD